MSEVGCSMGHWQELFVANQIKTSYSLRISGKEFMAPSGFLSVGGEAQILPRYESLIFCMSQCGPDPDFFFFFPQRWAMRTSKYKNTSSPNTRNQVFGLGWRAGWALYMADVGHHRSHPPKCCSWALGNWNERVPWSDQLERERQCSSR